jgi:hypothetical protein
MLASQEHLFPNLFQTILKTITPLMKGNLKDLEANENDGDSDEAAEADMMKCGPSGTCGL